MAWKVFRWTFVQMILVVNLTVAQTDLWETMKKGQLMAADEATLKMAMNMALANDYEAMAELTLLGRLALSRGGEQVAYVKVHQFTIEVRKKGSAKVWWIPIDALKEDNPKLAEEEPELEKYDHNAAEAEYLKEITDILAKNKHFAKLAKEKTAGKSGGVLSEAQRIARWFIDRGKELEKEGEVGDVQYWRATKIWLQMGFSPDRAAHLMPVFADTLIGEDGAVGDHDLPGLMGDAILGKKPALDKLGISVKNLQKFRSTDGKDRLTQVIQALEKRYKGANARAKAETASTEPSPTPTASPTPNPTPKPTPTPAALSPEDKAFVDAGGEWINTNTWGGRSKDDLNELISMASLNDVRAQARMVRAGRAITLNQGQRVQRLEVPLFSAMIKVRPIGETNSWWVPLEHTSDTPVMTEEEKLLSVEATKPGIAQKPLTGTVSAVKLFLGQPLSAWKKAYPSGKPTILNPFAYNFRTGRFLINVFFDKGSELPTQATVAAAEGKTPMTVKEATQIASSIGLANPVKDTEDPSYLNWNKDSDRIFAQFGTDKDDRSLTIYVKE